jgi:hypothetical protein
MWHSDTGHIDIMQRRWNLKRGIPICGISIYGMSIHDHQQVQPTKCSVAVTVKAAMEPIIKTCYMTSRVYGKTVALGHLVRIATDS